jgi:hypothetical protein
MKIDLISVLAATNDGDRTHEHYHHMKVFSSSVIPDTPIFANATELHVGYCITAIAWYASASPCLSSTDSNNPLFDIFKILASPMRNGYAYIPTGVDDKVLIIYIDASKSFDNCILQYTEVTPQQQQQISMLIAKTVQKANSEALVIQINNIMGVAPTAKTWLNNLRDSDVSLFQNQSYQNPSDGKISVNVILNIDVIKAFPKKEPYLHPVQCDGAPMLLVSNDLNDQIMAQYINNIAGEDAETVTQEIASTIADHREFIAANERCVVYNPKIVSGENRYAYYLSTYPNKVREVVLVKNPTPELLHGIYDSMVDSVGDAPENLRIVKMFTPYANTAETEFLDSHRADASVGLDPEIFKEPSTEGFGKPVADSDYEGSFQEQEPSSRIHENVATAMAMDAANE